MVFARFKNNRGIALLITLTVITILAVVTMELNREARFTAVAAALNRDRLTLFHMASAGIHAGMGGSFVCRLLPTMAFYAANFPMDRFSEIFGADQNFFPRLQRSHLPTSTSAFIFRDDLFFRVSGIDQALLINVAGQALIYCLWSFCRRYFCW